MVTSFRAPGAAHAPVVGSSLCSAGLRHWTCDGETMQNFVLSNRLKSILTMCVQNIADAKFYPL